MPQLNLEGLEKKIDKFDGDIIELKEALKRLYKENILERDRLTFLNFLMEVRLNPVKSLAIVELIAEIRDGKG